MTSEAFNVDCMEYMRTLPEKAFDLAIVDPPYGGSLSEGIEKQIHELGAHYVGRGRQKRYAEAYDEYSQTVHVERERTRGGITASETPEAGSSDTSVSRTGGTWAAKYGKKS